MHLEAHAGLGWAIGVLAPGSDRRLRNVCVAAALIPDVDAVTYLFGYQAYADYHHTFGHNVFVGLALAGLAVWWHRDRPAKRRALAAGLAALAFASHLLTDAWFTRYPVYPWWPFSRQEFLFEGGVGLVAPINVTLIYASFALVFVLALLKRVTPLDVFSPGLDRLFLGFFRRRTLSCATCQAKTNAACHGCEQPVCGRHGTIGKGFCLACPGCAGAEAP
jgi:hypothetical protein